MVNSMVLHRTAEKDDQGGSIFWRAEGKQGVYSLKDQNQIGGK